MIKRFSKYIWYTLIVVAPHALKVFTDLDIDYTIMWQGAMICLVASEYEHKDLSRK